MRSLGVLVYPNFELLDLFGPVEMFGWLSSEFSLTLVGPKSGPTKSNMGVAAVADIAMTQRSKFDVLLVPGGWGKSIPVDTEKLLPWLTEAAQQADRVLTVCTGSALLSLTGHLDGHRATTNKALFDWVAEKRPDVQWQPQARWVRDGKYYTSSGVTAGMDMALAAISEMIGLEKAEEVAKGCEYEWNQDPDRDPFAGAYGYTG
jgi:transcriptional regulator GlxA family with amidase domain